MRFAHHQSPKTLTNPSDAAGRLSWLQRLEGWTRLHQDETAEGHSNVVYRDHLRSSDGSASNKTAVCSWFNLALACFFGGRLAFHCWSNKPQPNEQLERCAEERQELWTFVFFCSRLESKVNLILFRSRHREFWQQKRFFGAWGSRGLRHLSNVLESH